MAKRRYSDVQRTHNTRANTYKKVLRERRENQDNHEEARHRGFGRPGRLAPRWVEDLYAGLLSDGKDNVLFQTCESLRNGRNTSDESGHKLLMIGSQSQSSNTSHVLSCICKHCKYHFVFRIVSEGPLICGNIQHKQYLLHHLVVRECQPSESSPALEYSKYYPLVSRVRYECSAEPCTLAVVVEVSEPRITDDFITLLTDHDRIRHRHTASLEDDPQRFADLKRDTPYTAPVTLDKYLRDVVDGSPESPPKKIAVRNKRFFVQFGDPCNEIFEYLEFSLKTIGDEDYWLLPVLEPSIGTEIGSRRAFFEDAKSEVQSLIDDEFRDATQNPVQPIPVKARLERALDCYNPPNTTKPKEHDNPADIRTLGANPNFDERLLSYAYHCQTQSDPQSKESYLSALKGLAASRADPDLQLEVATLESLKEMPPVDHFGGDDPLANAYVYFQLSPDCTEADEFILSKYKVFRQQSPAQKLQHREALIIIGKARNSDKILEAGYEEMELHEALNYLEAGSDWPSDSIGALAETQVSTKDTRLLSEAVMAVGRQRGDLSLKNTADKIRELGAALEHDRAGGGGFTAINTGFGNDSGQVRMDLPVGLDNLRNTCYLNSILQYFFTVKPVRDIVLNFDEYKMEATEENLKSRRIGGNSMELELGDAFVARNFVDELRTLFQNLETASTSHIRPKQRLANAALLSASQLIKGTATEPSKPFIGPQLPPAPVDKDLPPPPPLPARPSPAPPVPGRDNSRSLVVTVDAVPEQSEVASNVSSQTLVNHIDSDSVNSHEKVNITVEPVDADTMSIEVKDSIDGSAADRPITVNPTQIDTNYGGVDTVHTGEAVTGDDAEMKEPELTTVEKLTKALDNETIHGTNQEDVEEVMGKVIQHLHAAIKPTRVDAKSGFQTDQIVETFYCTTINHTKKASERTYNREIGRERWVTAFPAEKGSTHLYDALDRNFDQQFIDADTERFTSIKEAPPILHICIQRSAPNGKKNENSIVIPAEISLDRYMDSEPGSGLFKSRQRSWNLKRRLGALNGSEPDKAETNSGSKSKEDKPADDIPDSVLNDFVAAEDRLFMDGTSDDEGFEIVNPELAALLKEHNLSVQTLPLRNVDAGMDEESWRNDLNPALAADFATTAKSQEDVIRAELGHIFDNMNSHTYRLHAVICHGGERSTSGHYWVWIFDFEKSIWRKYNDTVVSENYDTEAVLGMLSSKGEPYYLAYVRSEDKDALVDIPHRSPQPEPEKQSADIEMQDMEGVEHVENQALVPSSLYAA